MINSSIPIIDFKNISDTEGKKQIVKEIHDACKNYGFFYIINHCVEESLMEDLQRISKKFFLLPKDVKMKWKLGLVDKVQCGYYEVGSSQTYGIDYKEGVYIDLEREWHYKSPNYNGKKIYPTQEEEIEYDIVGYRNIIETYIKRVSDLSDIVLQLISQSLNLPLEYFNTKKTVDLTVVLSMLKYPSFAKLEYEDENTKKEDGNEKLGMGLHTDWGLITLLYQDEIGGLQVKAKDQFIDATPIKGSFICNLGDFIEIATQGYYISNYHRVLYNTTPHDRYSYPFFVSPEQDTPMEIIKGYETITENENKIQDKEFYDFRGTYKEYFENQMNNTFKKYHK
ncbi:hypothetical protein DICPUDRAFT_28539 [Dictyostelium purpureum]|uniref:Fe2OG dioxygenase domain-containing protein n=1 Tax=Dictyostelium purpureum TaxID=5786 RepID=F0ZC09_DICPU|nr:uncharacterized protein DICPUDRAFT_28539 [Dictyostelium purpureum]EGC38487.1 hypothetical protein DICPUDRAFT_28539 [Dictyostelium purpureum]|eukprot:XP_003284952.1 hypothetical protein DICPUDRAFT_28539 [Dictyostelium purpureum]